MDIHKCYSCSIGIYNMTTIVAILISFKDHLFPPLRQIESKLGLRDRGNMDIQNCLNHSILISNLAPMATILIFFSKGIALQTIHVFQVILKLVGRLGANMGIETFLTRLIQVLTTETYNVLHWHLLVSGRSQRYETIHYKDDESFIVCMF